MDNIADNTPIIIGAGQAVELVPDDLSKPASHADIAGQAAVAALRDTGVSDPKRLAAQIDKLACTRLFSDSLPGYECPFGRADNFPRAVAARIGANPDQAVYDVLGGETPQTLVAEAARDLISGRARAVLIAGGEALANMRAGERAGANMRAGERAGERSGGAVGWDWSEHHDGSLEDRGAFSGAPLIHPSELAHNINTPMAYYGLMETARRLKLGQSVPDYTAQMAELFAPLSSVAAHNPYAMFRTSWSASEIGTQSATNRPLVSPYLKSMVAKSGVNQGAALIMTTRKQARLWGVAEDRWVYPRAHAQAAEPLLLERTELGHSLALEAVFRAVLAKANLTVDDITHLDLYSCFPIVVSLAKSVLGIEDDRQLSLTGGLPFFGGPGNNYTLHGIIEVVQACRAAPGTVGLAHGNGGWLSKQAVGLYSTQSVSGDKALDIFADTDDLAAKIQAQAQAQVQAQAQTAPSYSASPEGEAVMESFVVFYKKGQPVSATIVARQDGGGRAYAVLDNPSLSRLSALAVGEMDGARLMVRAGEPVNHCHFF